MNLQFTEQVKFLIKSIPLGKIATYGQIARLAGSPKAARQVSWILHSSSQKDNLPWHRVINNRGTISLPTNKGGEIQKHLLEQEGVIVDAKNSIDLGKYLWHF